MRPWAREPTMNPSAHTTARQKDSGHFCKVKSPPVPAPCAGRRISQSCPSRSTWPVVATADETPGQSASVSIVSIHFPIGRDGGRPSKPCADKPIPAREIADGSKEWRKAQFVQRLCRIRGISLPRTRASRTRKEDKVFQQKGRSLQP